MKIINLLAICLLLSLVAVSFIVMDKTAQSNKITVDVAKIQSENKSRVLIEVGLLTAEIRNLQKDMDTILSTLNEIKKKNQKKEL